MIEVIYASHEQAESKEAPSKTKSATSGYNDWPIQCPMLKPDREAARMRLRGCKQAKSTSGHEIGPKLGWKQQKGDFWH